MLSTIFKRTAAALLITAALSGCTVAGAAIGIAGAAVETGIGVTSAVVGTAADAVTD